MSVVRCPFVGRRRRSEWPCFCIISTVCFLPKYTQCRRKLAWKALSPTLVNLAENVEKCWKMLLCSQIVSYVVTFWFSWRNNLLSHIKAVTMLYILLLFWSTFWWISKTLACFDLMIYVKKACERKCTVMYYHLTKPHFQLCTCAYKNSSTDLPTVKTRVVAHLV